MGTALNVSHDLSSYAASSPQKTPSDAVFEIAYFLADFAHDNGMPDVSLKLEDVLDAVLEHETSASNPELPNMARSSQVSPRLKQIMADVITRQRAETQHNDA